MLTFIGTKDGIALYHIRYSTIIGCFVINGVTSCSQPKCWLIGIGLVPKLSCGQICCIGTPTCVIGLLGTAWYKKVMNYYFINLFNLWSTKG
jgi:hypothetical protein